MSTTAVQAPPQKTSSPKKLFQELVESDQFKLQIANALPKHLTPDRFIRVLMTATIKNPQLLQCTQESLFKGIFDCAAMGLEIDGRRAHLVPLKNRKKAGEPLEANLWLDYKGVAELVMRSGVVSNIHADIVCENDAFEVDLGRIIKHVVDYKKERGAMYAAYVIVRMKDGGEKHEVMSKHEIDKVRRKSPGANAIPWTDHYDEMAKKTVFKRSSKWLPMSAEVRDAFERDSDAIDVEAKPVSGGLAALVEGLPDEKVADDPKPETAATAVAAEGKTTPPVQSTPPDRDKIIDLLKNRILDEKSSAEALVKQAKTAGIVPAAFTGELFELLTVDLVRIAEMKGAAK